MTAMELPRTGDAGRIHEPAAPKIAGVGAVRAGTSSWTKAGVPKERSTAPGAEENTGVGKTCANTEGIQTSTEVITPGRTQARVDDCS